MKKLRVNSRIRLKNKLYGYISVYNLKNQGLLNSGFQSEAPGLFKFIMSIWIRGCNLIGKVPDF